MNVRSLSSALCAAVPLVLWLASTPARADEAAEAQAKEFFDAGRQAYQSGYYPAAARAFAQAYALSPKPAILFSEAQAYRLQYAIDDSPVTLKRAVELYQNYLAVEPDGRRRADAVKSLAKLKSVLQEIEIKRGQIQMTEAPKKTELMITSQTSGAEGSVDGGQYESLPLVVETSAGVHKVNVRAEGFDAVELEVKALEGRPVPVTVALKEKPAHLDLAAPEGSEVSLNGKQLGMAPFGGPIEIPAGTHLLSVTSRGSYAFTRELELKRGQSTSVNAELETTTQRLVAYGFLGLSAGLLGAGGASAIGTVMKQSAAQEIKDRQIAVGTILDGEQAVRYNELLVQRDELRSLTASLLVGAALVGVVGSLVFLLDDPSAPATGYGATLVPTVSSEGAGVLLGTGF